MADPAIRRSIFHGLTGLHCKYFAGTGYLLLNALPGNDDYKLILSIVEEEDLPYGQEYISLLARRGKIDAYKEGRNWITTKKAVKNYIENMKG